MGGGTILILCLSMFLGIEQHIAQASNLVFFIPTSIVAIITNIRQKYIDFKIGIPIAISGIIGAVIGAIIANNLDVIHLKKYFAMWEIYSLVKKYIYTKKRHNKYMNTKI